MGRKSSTAAITAVDAGVLAGLRPDFGALTHGLAAPNAWLARDGVDRALIALVGAALWITAAWVAVGLLAALAAHLPGPVGRLSARAARVLVPRVLQRVVAGSAGLGVLLAPVAAGAKTAPGRPTPSAVTSARSAPARSTSAPAPSWPLDPPSTPASGPHSPGAIPAPTWPAGRSASSGRPSSASPPGRTARPPASTSQPEGSAGSTRGTPPTPPVRPPSAAQPDPPPRRPEPPPARVAVRPGDSLWLIAARRLEPDATSAQIAAAWPRWYAANRAVIGADPALIRPGQVLAAPVDQGPTNEGP